MFFQLCGCSGQRGGELLEDVAILHTDSMKWVTPIIRAGSAPPPRVGHSAACCRDKVFIFGGMVSTSYADNGLQLLSCLLHMHLCWHNFDRHLCNAVHTMAMHQGAGDAACVSFLYLQCLHYHSGAHAATTAAEIASLLHSCLPTCCVTWRYHLRPTVV